MQMTHDQIERIVVTEGNEIPRAMQQQHLDLRAAFKREMAVKVAKPVKKCATYLTKNGRWLQYDRALAEDLPSATVVIEGLVATFRQGSDAQNLRALWSIIGAQAVLRIRALRASGDFDDSRQSHLTKEHARNHASRYADGISARFGPQRNETEPAGVTRSEPLSLGLAEKSRPSN
jgi:hypothetical protein